MAAVAAEEEDGGAAVGGAVKAVVDDSAGRAVEEVAGSAAGTLADNAAVSVTNSTGIDVFKDAAGAEAGGVTDQTTNGARSCVSNSENGILYTNPTTLLRAFDDDKLCQHFLEEPSILAQKNVRIVRVGPPGVTSFGIRPRSVGITKTRKCEVLWAVDVSDDGEEVIFARIRNQTGAWSSTLQAETTFALVKSILVFFEASKNTKVSAPNFFGVKFFEDLGATRHTFPADGPTRCFSCTKVIMSKPRYDQATLARLCDSSTCRSRKRKVVEDADDDEGSVQCVAF